MKIELNELSKEEFAAVMEFVMMTGKQPTAEQLELAKCMAERDNLTLNDALIRVYKEHKQRRKQYRF